MRVRQARLLPLGALIAGSTLGGATVGLASSAVVLTIKPLALLRVGLLLGIGGITIAALYLPSVCRLLPERGCQVPRVTMKRHTTVSAAGRWGFQLGTGVRSFLVTPAVYALLALSLAARSPTSAFTPWLVYGVGRGSAIATVALWLGFGASGSEERSPRLLDKGKFRPYLTAAILIAVLASLRSIV